MKVSDVMTTSLVTITPQTPWKQIAERMLEAGVSGLPVVDTEGYLVGLVTEADLISKPAFDGRRHRSLVTFVELLTGDAHWVGKASALDAGKLMTAAVITATPEEDVREAAKRMLDRRVKRLPVVDAGRLVGIVSRRDLLSVFHRTDEAIAAEIREKLGSVRYAPEGHQVTASVADGVVVLDGWVRMEDDLPVVEGLARRVAGVVGVVNHVAYHEHAIR